MSYACLVKYFAEISEVYPVKPVRFLFNWGEFNRGNIPYQPNQLSHSEAVVLRPSVFPIPQSSNFLSFYPFTFDLYPSLFQRLFPLKPAVGGKFLQD